MGFLLAQNRPPNAEATLAVFLVCYFAFIIAMVVFFVVCYCKICGKAGYSPWLGLLMLVPIANLILVGYLAFAEWPILKAQGRSGRRSRSYDDYEDDDLDERPRRRD